MRGGVGREGVRGSGVRRRRKRRRVMGRGGIVWIGVPCIRWIVISL